MSEKQIALQAIGNARDELCRLSDAIWDHPELGYQETFASGALCGFLEKHGFEVQRGIAGIPTAFMASFGTGSPVIGLLGEYDALPGLSQKAAAAEKIPLIPDGPGHGCGHNLLGVGSLGAALAVKAYLEQGHRGTVRFFGCPAEEGGSGKTFMARDGVFDSLDAVFTWHPGDFNCVSMEKTTANYQIAYHFKGISSHAAISPELGRSALDAAELMNVGVQFLREHMKPDIRIHYAFQNAGGTSPGIVQPQADLLYLMRAPQLGDARAIRGRVEKIAQGAAMMTETEVETEFIKACSNVIPNRVLGEVLQANLEECGELVFSEEDRALAETIRETIEHKDPFYAELASAISDPVLRERALLDKDSPLHGGVMPLVAEYQSPVSSDVGDVSHICPVAQITAATMPAGTPMHSWQEVAVGKSGIAHKGMIYAARVLAGAAIDVLADPDIAVRAGKELRERMGGQAYVSPIPREITPRI